jgi:hypothetical protein
VSFKDLLDDDEDTPRGRTSSQPSGSDASLSFKDPNSLWGKDGDWSRKYVTPGVAVVPEASRDNQQQQMNHHHQQQMIMNQQQMQQMQRPPQHQGMHPERIAV